MGKIPWETERVLFRGFSPENPGKQRNARYLSIPSITSRSTDIFRCFVYVDRGRLISSLETAAETAVVVDGEGADQVDRGRSAESYTETLSHVHRSFTAVSLTEGDLHTGEG